MIAAQRSKRKKKNALGFFGLYKKEKKAEKYEKKNGLVVFEADFFLDPPAPRAARALVQDQGIA